VFVFICTLLKRITLFLLKCTVLLVYIFEIVYMCNKWIELLALKRPYTL